MKIPLEDFASDVIAKAQRGLGISDSALVEKAGIAAGDLRAAKSGGTPDVAILSKIAEPLGLHAPSLVALARGDWEPETPAVPETFAHFNSPFGGDMTVNSYLVWDRPGGTAVAFDAGTDARPMRAALEKHGLRLAAVFLTHTHTDHVEALERLLAGHQDVPVYVSQRENHPGAEPIFDNAAFGYNGLQIEARSTRGHSPGGTTFVVTIDGCEPRPALAIVGDALFAGSQGGVDTARYAEALQLNRENILSLPDATIICPGHGPLTTVGEEKAHNPFHAAAESA